MHYYLRCLIKVRYIFLYRTPEINSFLNSDDVSEGDDFETDCVGEILNVEKVIHIEAQSCNIEKHDVSKLFILEMQYLFKYIVFTKMNIEKNR